MPTRKRLVAFTGAAAGALLLGTSPFWSTHVGRRIAYFEIQQVEISGTRLLDPREVLRVAGVTTGQNLMEETATWRNGLLRHPVIAAARVTRMPPHTLRIHITEKQPVALVSEGTLRLATAAGELLPIDPFAVPLDLPVVHGTVTDSARARTTREALAETERLTSLAPVLMRDVSEVRVSAETSGVLVLTHRAAEILLPVGASAMRIEELQRVLTDVERRFPAGAEGARIAKYRLDLRFADQIVVRRPSLGELS